MSGNEQLKEQIRRAFADVPYPGDDNLQGSQEGSEPFLLTKDFAGKTDWRRLDAEFLDSAPDGYASALSFFSHRALQFYLPAYLIADIDERLLRVDPVFRLCHGFDPMWQDKPINPQRYGDRTWNAYAKERFASYTGEQAAAIASYLEWCRNRAATDFERDFIDGGLSYWLGRTG